MSSDGTGADQTPRLRYLPHDSLVSEDHWPRLKTLVHADLPTKPCSPRDRPEVVKARRRAPFHPTSLFRPELSPWLACVRRARACDHVMLGSVSLVESNWSPASATNIVGTSQRPQALSTRAARSSTVSPRRRKASVGTAKCSASKQHRPHFPTVAKRPA